MTMFSGKMAVISDRLTGFRVPGCSGGAMGSGKSARRLYQWVGMSFCVSVKCVVSLMSCSFFARVEKYYETPRHVK